MRNDTVADTWEQGEPYEQLVGRWSRNVAPRFVNWLAPPPDRRWLDVGCGTGALCGAILAQATPAALVGVEPSAGFLAAARRRLGPVADLRTGTAAEIPLAGRSTDYTVSGLVLNFVPDAAAALTEMARVTAPGGTVAAYVWDYGDRMELLRYFWDAAIKLMPEAADRHEGTRFPICKPEALRQQFEGAGLEQIETGEIEVATPFRDFEDYWRPFLGGQGPASAFAVALPEPQRNLLRDRLRDRLPTQPDGTIPLVARAWTVRGRVPG